MGWVCLGCVGIVDCKCDCEFELLTTTYPSTGPPLGEVLCLENRVLCLCGRGCPCPCPCPRAAASSPGSSISGKVISMLKVDPTPDSLLMSILPVHK